MNYKSIKLASEAPIALELVKHDNSIKAVVIDDLRIEGDYGLRVMLAQPFEQASRHRVTATIEGFGSKVQYYEHRYLADEDVRKLEATGATVERADVTVLIDERGEVARTTLEKPITDSPDVPF